MHNTQITFERILGTFIPGALFIRRLVSASLFLLKYFTNIAGDPGVSSFGGLATEVRFLLFIFASLCLGRTYRVVEYFPTIWFERHQNEALRHE